MKNILVSGHQIVDYHSSGLKVIGQAAIRALLESGYKIYIFGDRYEDQIPGAKFIGYNLSGLNTTNTICFLAANGLIWFFKHQKKFIMEQIYASGIPIVTQLHDVIPCSPIAQHLNYNFAQYYNDAMMTVRISKAVITVSNYSKNEIEKYLPVCKGKIHVINNPIIYPEVMVNKYKDNKRLFQIISPQGAFEWRKKILNIAKATVLNGKVTLKLIGKPNPQHIPQEFTNLLNNTDKVIITGFLTQEELIKEYCSSIAVIFLSDIEGFGMPIIEGFACGTPVITNRDTSLEEVGGDAVVYVNKDDIHSISNAISLLVNNPDLWHYYAAQGITRAKLFSFHIYKNKLATFFSRF